jgi:dihydroorotase
MIIIKNVLDKNNNRQDIELATDSKQLTQIIDGSKLLVLPGLIDPHVHFRVPGMEHKEDWVSGSNASFKGGYTTVFDMPNTIPATNTYDRLVAKKSIIDEQLRLAQLPLRYNLFFGADKNNFHQISLVKDMIIGIKVFMGSSTGDLLLDDDSSLHAIYAIASKFNLIIALHAEDEDIIKKNVDNYNLDSNDYSCHSKIRTIEAATKAISKVIELSKIYNVRSYILHISTKEELELIRQAKSHGISIFAETCPHYLFLDESMYRDLKGYAKMNPPLRNISQQEYLFNAIQDGIIDTIASDHAPHTKEEKNQVVGKCPSGVPGIETTLALLLTAYKQNKITLSKILDLTHYNPKKIFNLADNDDKIFVNISDYKILTENSLATKVKWSPYCGSNLTGFTEYVYTNNNLYKIDGDMVVKIN